MEFIDKNKFTVFDKTFYNNENIVVINIIDKVFEFK